MRTTTRRPSALSPLASSQRDSAASPPRHRILSQREEQRGRPAAALIARASSSVTRELAETRGNNPKGNQNGFKLASDRITADFEAWAARAGIVAPKLRIADFDGLRGLVATSPIARGETIVRLPVEAAIMVRPKMKCPLPETWCSRNYWARAPWFTRAALMLLHALHEEEEKKKGSSSTAPSSSSSPSAQSSSSSSSSSSAAAAAAYAAALPARGSFDTPAVGRWSDEELERLHYGPLAEDVRAQRRSWSEAFAAYSQACPGSPIAGDEQSWDWALSCVRSRAFSGPYAGPALKQRLGLVAALAAAGLGSVFVLHAPPEQVLNGAIAAALFNLMYDALLSSKVKWHALCPLVDMANHSSRAASEMTYAYFGDALELSVGGLLDGNTEGGNGEGNGNGNGNANVAFEQGQQVFISYGPQTNDSLLQYYGFVEEANPNDVYRLVWEADGGGGGSGGERKKQEQAPPRTKLTTLMSRSGPDEASVEAVMEALGPAKTRADALKAIHAAAAREAANWPTTAAEDAKAVSSSSSSSSDGGAQGGGSRGGGGARFATALAFRLQKKRVLAAAAKSCLRQAGV